MLNPVCKLPWLLDLFPAELPARACIVADLLLAEHLELLFGQHVSVAIACAIYYTVRRQCRKRETGVAML